MARIRVTGFIDEDSIDPRLLDPEHEMGITDEAFLSWSTGAEALPAIEDLEFLRVD